jgi:hypothetical protein
LYNVVPLEGEKDNTAMPIPWRDDVAWRSALRGDGA